MNKLLDKIALITGGSSGIGLATARLMIAEGAKVAIVGRNLQRLKEATKELGGIYDRFTEGQKSPDLAQAAQLLQTLTAAPSE